jgi:hypothetical protein
MDEIKITPLHTLAARLSVIELLMHDIIAHSLADEADLQAWMQSIAPGASAAADARGLTPEAIAYQTAWDDALTGVQRQFAHLRRARGQARRAGR